MLLIKDIKSPEDLKKLDSNELENIVDQIRVNLIDIFSKKGGHVGPNLGIIELAVALHYAIKTPEDKIVWDVSHQSLPHKILTGRYEEVQKFHEVGGVSPFTNTNESVFDCFNVGHTSTSISLGAGLAKGRDFSGENHRVISVIGDGSLSGGEALEGLNIAGTLNSQFLIIVNDNDMSIDPNSGGLYSGLAQLRDTNGQSDNNIFKSFGLDYVYFADGNDVLGLVETINQLKDHSKPVVLHIKTKKGKGLKFAEETPKLWHYHSAFDKNDGGVISSAPDKHRALPVSSVDITLNFLEEEIKNKQAVVINAGSPMLGHKLQENYSESYLDVGIAEQSAIAFGSGIASNCDIKPYFVIPSSFIHRAYDQIIQDWTLNNTSACLLILSASITQTDWTHAGIYDIPMLSNIPNLVYLSPTSDQEYLQMLNWCKKQNFPTAIRTSGVFDEFNNHRLTPQINTEYTEDLDIVEPHTISGQVLHNNNLIVQSELYQKGSEVVFYGLGHFFELAIECASYFEEKTGIKPSIVNPRFISHLDTKLLDSLLKDHKVIVTLEDGICEGGFGVKVASYCAKSIISNPNVLVKGAYKEHIDSINLSSLVKRYHLSKEQIFEDVIKCLNK